MFSSHSRRPTVPYFLWTFKPYHNFLVDWMPTMPSFLALKGYSTFLIDFVYLPYIFYRLWILALCSLQIFNTCLGSILTLNTYLTRFLDFGHLLRLPIWLPLTKNQVVGGRASVFKPSLNSFNTWILHNSPEFKVHKASIPRHGKKKTEKHWAYLEIERNICSLRYRQKGA